MTKIKPHPGLSYRQQSAIAKKLGIKFDEVPEALKDFEALGALGLLDSNEQTTKTSAR